jgi:hypothetical protein
MESKIKREQIENLSLCKFLKNYYNIELTDDWRYDNNTWNFACENTNDGYEIWAIYDKKGKLFGGIEEAVFYEEDGLITYFFDNFDEFSNGTIYSFDVQDNMQTQWDDEKECILEDLDLIEEDVIEDINEDKSN